MNNFTCPVKQWSIDLDLVIVVFDVVQHRHTALVALVASDDIRSVLPILR